MDEDMTRDRATGSEWGSADADAAEAFSEAASPEVDDSGNPTAASPDLSGGELGAESATSIPVSGPMGGDEGPELQGHPDSPGAGSRTVDAGASGGGSGDEWRESATPDDRGSGTDYGSSGGGGGESPPSGAGGSGGVAPMIAQLQSMIDNITTQAAPVLREVAAKAAELAAAAGERAGPVAHRAAEVTQRAGETMATRGREVAANLRQGPGAGAGTQQSGGSVEEEQAGGGPGTGPGL